MSVDSLSTYLDSHSEKEGASAFTQSERTAAIDSMSDDNMIMISNDIIFLI